jgi:hypothetical protein
MIGVVHSRSRIRILTLSIPDPGSRGQKGTGSWIPDPQYYAKPIYQFHGIDAWNPEKFENLGSASLSLHTNVCTLKTLVAKAEMY